MAVAFFVAFFSWSQRRTAHRFLELRVQVDQALRQALVEKLPPAQYCAPEQLRLIRDVEEKYSDDGSFSLQATRLYQLPTGAYILFICTSGLNGYLKPLDALEAARHLRTSPEILAREFPNYVGGYGNLVSPRRK
jgi:hypothetical protein